jgi:hypothetical protein
MLKQATGRKPKPSVPAVDAGATPLDYLLAIMRDSTVPAPRRDKAAFAALPFIHRRLSPIQPDDAERPVAGKKAKAAKAAKNPDASTPMGELLKRRGGQS